MDRRCGTWIGLLLTGLGACSRQDPAPPFPSPTPSEVKPVTDATPSARAAAARLLSDFRSVGLFLEGTEADFLGLLGKHVDPGELGGTWEETKDRPDALLYLRQALLCRLRGLIQDVGFSAGELLPKARRHVPDLAWEAEARGPVKSVGKIRLQERRIVLSLDGRRLDWTYSLTCGLLEGLNRLLRDSGRPGRFIGLATDGDYYGYVWGDEALERRLSGSPLFKLRHDPDPLLR